MRNYLFRIFNKAGASSRLELALFTLGLRNGHVSRADNMVKLLRILFDVSLLLLSAVIYIFVV